MNKRDGVEIVLDGFENNPQCFHGPSILFKRKEGKVKEYYACSASRDHKECPFFVEASGNNVKKLQSNSKWIKLRREAIESIRQRNPYKKYLRILKNVMLYNKIKKKSGLKKAAREVENFTAKKKKKKKVSDAAKAAEEVSLSYHEGGNLGKESKTSAAYCYSCDELFEETELVSHEKCKTIRNLNEFHLRHPTEILIPKEDSKTHAQYFFSRETVENIVLLLSRLRTRRVLCIGAPRIHEHLLNESDTRMQSLLLDIDSKYFNFYSDEQFIWYNMFNNHVFQDKSLETLREFMKCDEVAVVMDPPFGGRVEPLLFTLNSLNKLYREVNGFGEGDAGGLGVFWIFPYFMERHIKSGAAEFEMFDLRIDYENHASFASVGRRRRKNGSPVRIFTNVDLSALDLAGVDGYRFCGTCRRWVSRENRHCGECGCCTSKNGTTYVHCYDCSRCVKPSYRHCYACSTCALPDHSCGGGDVETCYHCKKPGHKKRDCPDGDVRRRKKKKKQKTRT